MLGGNGIPSSAGANWENLVEGGESKTLSAVKMELNKFRVTCDSKQQAQLKSSWVPCAPKATCFITD